MDGSTYIAKQTIISYVSESPSVLRSMPACNADEVNMEVIELCSQIEVHGFTLSASGSPKKTIVHNEWTICFAISYSYF